MKSSRYRSSHGSGTPGKSNGSSSSSRRRRQMFGNVPRLTPTSSESSTSTSSTPSKYAASPDDSIFKGAEILRSELLSPQKSLWSVNESYRGMDDSSFDDDDWSNPWSVQDNVKTPSPSSYKRYSPKSTDMSSSSSTPGEKSSTPGSFQRVCHRRCSSDSWSTPGSYYRRGSKNGDLWSPEASRKNVSLDEGYPALADDATNWSADFQDASLFSGLDASITSSSESPPPPPPKRPPPSDEEATEFGSQLTPASDATPTTTMGRESSLRFKTVTYLVEPNIGEERYDDDVGYINSRRDYDDDYNDYEDEDDSGYVPSKYQPQQQPRQAPTPSIDTSGFWDHMTKLSKDPAYLHAQSAGVLWQTLVGQHVKFPKTWWNGARSPPMGLEDTSGKLNWRYIARHKVYNNATFQKYVKHRSSSGRLLLHLVVRDLMTFYPLQDVVIGCLHPNARGVRKTDKPNPKDEACREIYMAIRKRPAALENNASPSLIDPLLTRGRGLEEIAHDSPLGGKRKVSNVNMKAVFGEKPPLETVFVDESELYERMMAAEEQDSFAAPALVLLNEFT